MNCSILRNKEGQITNVLDKDGIESQLYKNIARHPLIKSTEVALDIYKNIYTDKLKDIDEANMQLSHRVGDAQYNSLKEALKSVQENAEISVGILTNGNFTELISVTKNSEPTSELGFIQNGILNNLISEDRIKVGNNYELQGYGQSEVRQLASLATLRDLTTTFDVIQDATTFKVNKKQPLATLYTKSGQAVNEDVTNLSDDEIRRRFDNADVLIANNLYVRNFPEKRDTPTSEQEPVQIKGDEELVKNLTNLLKNMGISVVSMTNYITHYNLRHGVNPNAEALADVANQVVAITAGQETVENLLEETIHFIVEALPQEKIENLIRNIDKSEEYKQHYQIQKAIYESEYSGEELENVVRREILAKILLNAVNQTQEVLETQQNFFENAKRFISEFFQNIINYFKPQYLQDLDAIISDVQNLIVTQDVTNLDLDNFEGNLGRFYNVTDPIIAEARKIITQQLKLERDLSKNGKSNALNVRELKRAQNEIDKQKKVEATAVITKVVDNTVKMLFSALEDSASKNKNYDLSTEEAQIYENLVGGVRQGLAIIKEKIDSSKIKSDKDAILSENISKTISRISELEAKRTVAHNGVMERLARSVTTDRGLPESDFNNIMAWSLRAESDINVIRKTFGTMQNSNDSLANIYATLKTNQTNESNQRHYNQTKQLQGILRENDFDEKYAVSIMKDGYFESERDLTKFNNEIDRLFLEAYKKEISDNILTDEKILSGRDKNNLPWTEEQREIIEKDFDEKKVPNIERQMNDEYYAELEVKQNTVNLSKNTKDFLQAIGSQRNKIVNKIKDANGIADYSLLSKQDITVLTQLAESRRLKKSLVDENGNILRGLKVIKDKNGDTKLVLQDNVSKEDLGEDSRIALDLFELDSYKTPEQKLKEEQDKINGYKRPKKFDDLILSKESRDEAILAMNLNANIIFTADFWEATSANASMVDKLRDLPESEEIDLVISKLEDLNIRKTALLKTYTKFNNPSETDFENMPVSVRENIKSLEEEAEFERALAQGFLKNTVSEEVENEGVSATNQSWEALLVDNQFEIESNSISYTEDTTNKRLDGLLALAKKHATKRNANAITDAESNVRNFVNNGTRISKSVENSLAKQGMTREDLMDGFKRTQFLKTYAEDRLLSYFKRYTPQSYIDYQADLENPNVPIADILNKEYKYLQITPNYSFNEDTDVRTNPNFIVNSKMGFMQPKKELYENKAFKRFGTVVRDKDGMYVSATENQKEFNAYKAIMNYRFNQIVAMDGGGNYNSYITPQVRKGDAERIFGNKNISTQKVKDFWENLSQYTEDDQIYGDATFGAENKIIPKQYFAKLSSQSDVSQDVFGALIMTNIAGNLYQSKMKYWGEILAIQDVAKTRETLGSNQDTVATERYKMLESAIDNDQFGIRRTATDKVLGADVGKVVDGLGKYLRIKGLGFNPIIPATAYLTGKSKQIVERVIGEYVNKDSWKRGSKAYNSTLKDASGEIGKVYTTSQLNSKMEFWGAFDLKSRVENTNLSTVSRYLSKTSMIMYQASSYPIYGKGMMNVLHDYRIVNGKVMKFTDFQRAERTKDYKITVKEIQDKWASNDDVINNYHSANEDGSIVWDKVKLKTLLRDSNGLEYTDQALDNEILRFSNDIRVQIKNLNVRFDLQLSPEDKVAANRNYLLNFLMSFKGYTIPLFEERFKPTKLNDQSRQLEGGSYTGVFELGRDVYKEWQLNGNKFIQAFKTQYNGDFSAQESRIVELKAIPNRTAEQDLEIESLNDEIVRMIEKTDLRHSMMKRLGVDLVTVNALIALVMVLRSYADDDKEKDNYSLQLSYLMASRLTNEINSANLNIGSAYYEIIDNPLSAFSIITSVADLPKAYEDEKLLSTMSKNYLPFINSLNQLQDPGKTADNIRYYSEVKANAFFHSPIYLLMTEE